jgi:hypothetical protein
MEAKISGIQEFAGLQATINSHELAEIFCHPAVMSYVGGDPLDAFAFHDAVHECLEDIIRAGITWELVGWFKPGKLANDEAYQTRYLHISKLTPNQPIPPNIRRFNLDHVQSQVVHVPDGQLTLGVAAIPGRSGRQQPAVPIAPAPQGLHQQHAAPAGHAMLQQQQQPILPPGAQVPGHLQQQQAVNQGNQHQQQGGAQPNQHQPPPPQQQPLVVDPNHRQQQHGIQHPNQNQLPPPPPQQQPPVLNPN